MTKKKKIVLVVLLAVIGLPLVLMLAAFAWFRWEGATNGSVMTSGEARKYLLYVPKSYDRSKPTPLIISFHAAALRPQSEMEISRWNEVADQLGFIVVYPSGSDLPRVWPGGTRSLPRDVKYISDLIDKLAGEYNIDPRRIYADGMSNGGGMSFALSCKLGDRIAAAGAVSSAQTLPWERCDGSKPVPLIVFHGTADRFAPYHGGASPVAPEPFPDIPEWIARAAQRNQCKASPVETRVSPSVRRLSYGDCAGNADVVFYSVEGGGHTWPGGGPLPEWIVGPTTHEISADRIMWDFFMAHPLGGAKQAASSQSSALSR